MWTIWLAWCEKDKRTSDAKEQKVADFLIYLRRKRKLAVSSIKCYRAMLTSVYRYKGRDFSSSRTLHEIIRSYKKEDEKKTISTPNWDLDIVLRHLQTHEDYEPLDQISFRNLTKKTLFLVSLATAKGVSELQGLSSVVIFSGSNAYVQYIPEFVPKTSTADNPCPRDFKIKSISKSSRYKHDDLRLCPVRALRIYLDKTKSQSPRCRNLFVQLKDHSKAMSKNGISFFLRLN